MVYFSADYPTYNFFYGLGLWNKKDETYEVQSGIINSMYYYYSYF